MSRYQNQPGIATSRGLLRTALCWSICLFFLWLRGEEATAARLEFPALSNPSSPLVQVDSGNGLIYLTPIETTPIGLKTHTAELLLQYDGSTGLAVNVESLYRLQNPDGNAESVLVRIGPAETASRLRLPVFARNIILTVDGVFQELQPADNGTFTVLVSIDADSQRDLFLTYSLPLDDLVLPRIQYRAADLKAWGGTASWRISMATGAGLERDSRLQISPAGWNYAVESDIAGETIKWLHETQPADEPYTIHFIHPAYYQSLRNSRQVAETEQTAAAYVQLAEQYRRLYDAAQVEQAGESIVTRLYAQTLAALISGLERVGDSDSTEQIDLQMALTRLYRSRIVPLSGNPDMAYAQLTVDAGTQALNSMHPLDARYPELVQWQLEGLTLLLNNALDRNDLHSALSLIESIEALPVDSEQTAAMSEARRMVTIQQALRLLEQGERDAAVALAGAQILESVPQPDESAPALFSGWQITTTLTTERVALDIIVLTQRDHYLRARTALQQQVALWNASSLEGAEAAVYGEDEQRLQLEVNFPLTTAAVDVAGLVPAGIDWILLRSLLQQLSPQIELETGVLRMRRSIVQPLDLRPVADQWRAKAAALEQQADRIEANAAADSNDLAAASGDLQARIEAINYRNAARSWHELVENSWMLLHIQLPDRGNQAARTWSVTLTSPAQSFVYQRETISMGRLAIIVVFTLIGLILLSAVLWRWL